MNNNLTEKEKEEWSRLETAADKSRLAWRRLWLGLVSITPKDWARLLILLGFTAVVGRVIWVSTATLTPFIIGGIIAYILLPTVNRLNRFMPRLLAVLLTLTAVVFLLSTFINITIPPLVNQLYRGYLNIPTLSQVNEQLSALDQYLRTFPTPVQDFVDGILSRTVTTIRTNADLYINNLINFSINSVLTFLNTIGFLVGFLAVPAWLLTVLVDQKKGKDALNQLLPTWFRPDFWAVVRIVDRTFSAFLRGQLLLALIVGLSLYTILWLMPQLGLPDINYKILLAIFAGTMQLIPSIGPFFGIIPLLVIGFNQNPQTGLLLLTIFISLQLVIQQTITPRIERRVIELHPAILVIIIVALSNFGWWWVILAAPVTGIFYELTRYLLGRLRTPPRPAGILPKEPLPITHDNSQNRRPHPTVYRRLGPTSSRTRARDRS